MGALRVTQRLLAERTLADLSKQMRELMKWQERLATGLRVNAPSDNPLDARRAIDTRATIAEYEQYIDNISGAQPYLVETDTSIQTVVDALQRAQELTIRGASESQAQPQLDQLAIEINQILENVLSQANHLTNDRYIFAGTRTTAPPFQAARDASGEITAVNYVGNSDDISIPVGNGVELVTNLTGDDVFQSVEDVFQMLIDIRDDLRAGDQDSLQASRLGQLESALGQMLEALARVGAVENRADTLANDTQDFVLNLEEVLSDAIDADYADTVLNLNAQSNAYQAALQAAARVIQPSLLDFVR